MVNRVILSGRLVRDPEVRTTTTGKKVADFSIAVNRKYKPSDGSGDADFFRVTAWGQTAEYLESYVTKGRLVIVEGRLQSRKYTDKQGNNREAVEVVADSVTSLDRAKDDNSGGGSRDDNERGEIPVRTGGGASDPIEDEYDPFADN